MSGKSAIAWTDATWNPLVGCTMCAAGCRDCYAMRWVHERLSGHAKYAGLVDEKGRWTGDVRFWEPDLMKPLSWSSRVVFVDSMGDVFHPGVREEWIDQIYAVMAAAWWHVFIVLTKRPERRLQYHEDGATPGRVQEALEALPISRKAVGQRFMPGALTWPLENVIEGVSISGPQDAGNVVTLCRMPAASRVLSYEPALEYVDLTGIPLGAESPDKYNALTGLAQDGKRTYRLGTRLDWVIVGGEKGPRARAMPLGLPGMVRSDCEASATPFWFKQWGGQHGDGGCELAGATYQECPRLILEWKARNRETGRRSGRLVKARGGK